MRRFEVLLIGGTGGEISLLRLGNVDIRGSNIINFVHMLSDMVPKAGVLHFDLLSFLIQVWSERCMRILQVVVRGIKQRVTYVQSVCPSQGVKPRMTCKSSPRTSKENQPTKRR